MFDFEYRIIKKKRKSLGLYIKDGFVEARAPYWLRDQEIIAFLDSKQDWVREQLAAQAMRQAEAPSFEHASQCLFFGEYRMIEHHIGKPQVLEQGNRLHVFHYAAKENKASKHADYMAKWLRKEAEQYLRQRTYELEIEVQPPKAVSEVQFRKTKSKWGHCTAKGEIQLNWLLIMSPPEVMDYVIIHELCHLTHMNHSAAYWQLVEHFCPDYKDHRAWLADHGHKISFV